MKQDAVDLKEKDSRWRELTPAASGSAFAEAFQMVLKRLEIKKTSSDDSPLDSETQRDLQSRIVSGDSDDN